MTGLTKVFESFEGVGEQSNNDIRMHIRNHHPMSEMDME